MLATGAVALLLKNPIKSSKLRQKHLPTPEAYNAVYAEHFPLNAWPIVASLIRSAENAITRAYKARRVMQHGQHLAAWRGLLAYVAAARICGTFSFKHQDLVAIDTESLTDVFMDESWSAVRQAVGAPGSAKLSAVQIMKVASALHLTWGIVGHPADGKRELPISDLGSSHPKKMPRFEQEDFLLEVSGLLPPQPWKPRIHVKVADALSAKTDRVSNAIQILIARGVWLQQRDGVVFDKDGNEVARDESRRLEP